MRVVDLAERGKMLVDWAYRNMPVIKLIREEFRVKKPLASLKIGACLHITAETANLVITLKEGGANVILTASNPLSTKLEIVEYLTKYEGIEVLSKPSETPEEYYINIKKVIESNPNLLIDDGGDLIVTINKEYKTIASKIIGATEETTTGVIRTNNLYNEGKLYFPVIAVNNAKTKHMFDNRYGTGQSTIDGILRATNILIAGKVAVVAGYGWCGKGVAGIGPKKAKMFIKSISKYFLEQSFEFNEENLNIISSYLLDFFKLNIDSEKLKEIFKLNYNLLKLKFINYLQEFNLEELYIKDNFINNGFIDFLKKYNFKSILQEVQNEFNLDYSNNNEKKQLRLF